MDCFGTRKREGTVAAQESDTRWRLDGLVLSYDSLVKVRVSIALDCCDRQIVNWVASTKGIAAGLVCDMMIQAVE